MSRTKMTNIDGEKLQRLLEVAGVSAKEAALEMGFSGDYVRDCIRSGRMAQNAVKSLERTYKIKAEDFAKIEEAPKAEEEKKEPEDLKELITEAVLEALKRWKGEEIVAAMEKWREETRG